MFKKLFNKLVEKSTPYKKLKEEYVKVNSFVNRTQSITLKLRQIIKLANKLDKKDENVKSIKKICNEIIKGE